MDPQNPVQSVNLSQSMSVSTPSQKEPESLIRHKRKHDFNETTAPSPPSLVVMKKMRLQQSIQIETFLNLLDVFQQAHPDLEQWFQQSKDCLAISLNEEESMILTLLKYWVANCFKCWLKELKETKLDWSEKLLGMLEHTSPESQENPLSKLIRHLRQSYSAYSKKKPSFGQSQSTRNITTSFTPVPGSGTSVNTNTSPSSGIYGLLSLPLSRLKTEKESSSIGIQTGECYKIYTADLPFGTLWMDLNIYHLEDYLGTDRRERWRTAKYRVKAAVNEEEKTLMMSLLDLVATRIKSRPNVEVTQNTNK